MDVQELTRPVESEKKKRRGWLVASSAFAAVIVIVGAAMLLARPTDELPPATTPSTTEAMTPSTVAAVEEATPTTQAVVDASAVPSHVMSVIEALEDAVNTANPSEIEVLLAADFSSTSTEDVREGFSDDSTGFAHRHAYYAAEGSTYALSDCKTDEGAVMCTSTWSGPAPKATSGSNSDPSGSGTPRNGSPPADHRPTPFWRP